MGASSFTGAYSFAPNGGATPLDLLMNPDARAQPGSGERQQMAYLAAVMQADPGGQQLGAWGGDRYEQTNHYTGAVALAIKPYLNAMRAAKFKVLRRKPQRDGVITKSAGVGHFSRDEEYEPVDPTHPLCKILARPNGENGKWSMSRELTYLTLQYMLTGDAPAWCPPNAQGKPVQFYALVSAQTYMQIGPGQDQRYPKGAYRVTPFAGGNSFGMGGGLYAGAILPGEEVHRLTDEEPWMRGAGRSRLHVGAAHIDVFEQVTKSRHSFLRQGSQLGAAIVLPGADGDVCKQLQAQINQKHGGAENHGNRILILGGGGMSDKAAIQPLSMTDSELGFFQSYDQTLEFVLALFGANRVVCHVGEMVSNKATYIAAKYQFRDGSLVPFFLRCSDFLTTALAEPWSEEPGELKIEVEPPPLDDIDMEEEQWSAACQRGTVYFNEDRRRLNLDPVGPEGDVPISVYVQVTQQKLAPPPQPAVGDPNAAPGAQQVGPGGQTAEIPANGDENAPEMGADGTAEQEDTPEATQDAVGGAALAALGVPADGADGEQQADAGDPLAGLLGGGVQKALHKFGSTHVELPAEIGDRLKALAAMIPDRDLGEDGREDEPHVTIRYGLEVDDPGEVAAIVRDFGPIRLTLGKVSLFAGADSGKPYDVLKVEVDSLDLHELNQLLAELPHTDTHPTYCPHATIAYVKAGLGAKYAEKMGAVNVDAVATEMVFSDRDRNQTHIPLTGVQKAIPVTKPGRTVRREGERWQVGAQWYTKKNGQAVKIADPSKQGGGAKPVPPAGDTESLAANADGARQTTAPPPLPTADYDELARRMIAKQPAGTPLKWLDSRTQGVPIRNGADIKAFIEAGNKPPAGLFEDHAKAVPGASPTAQKTLASVDKWAYRHAEQHAERVAAHFGISKIRAHSLLLHAYRQVAAHAAKNGGKVGTLSIRSKQSGKTATLTPKDKGPTAGAVPRPANPAAAGSRPPVAKAMSSLSGPDGGVLVDGARPTRRRKRKARACVERVLKSLEQEG